MPICTECGSTKTYIRSNGREEWYKQGTQCSKCRNKEYNVLNSAEISERRYELRHLIREPYQRIHCISCLGTYSRSSWRRVFEDGILIGWECSKCRSEYNKEQSLLRKKIKIGMRALGRYEKLYKNRCNGYYSVKNRKEIQRKVFEHYSNGTMKCAICGTTKKLCIDHVNHDGKEERSRLFGKTSASCGGHHFHKYLYEKGFPKGYRVLCMKCNLKYYADNVHIIIPRRFINDNKNKPKILKWYKEYLMELFKKESLNEDL